MVYREILSNLCNRNRNRILDFRRIRQKSTPDACVLLWSLHHFWWFNPINLLLDKLRPVCYTLDRLERVLHTVF